MKVWIAAAAAALALTTAGPAHADPEGDYLAILGNTPGVTINGFTGPMLTGAG
jgi:hypothetical protein